MTTPRIKVLIADDHQVVREGTKAILSKDPNIAIVGEAETAEEAIRLVEVHKPDVLLLDLRLKGGTGLEVARALQRKPDRPRIIVVSAYDFERYVQSTVRAGVMGYLTKDASAAEILEAVHSAYQGHGVLKGQIAATVLRGLSGGRAREEQPDDLTVREVEVLELMSGDYSNGQIGERLGISVRTVEAHVSNILEKLNAPSRKEAIRIGIQQGFIKEA